MQRPLGSVFSTVPSEQTASPYVRMAGSPRFTASVLHFHARLDTTALYAQVATNVIRAVMSPLDRLTPLTSEKKPPS